MSDPTVKFCLDHPQKWLQIFQVSGKAGRFGLVKPGHLPNFSPICLFLGGTFKIVIDIAKKKVQTFLNSTMFRGSYGPPPILIRHGVIKPPLMSFPVCNFLEVWSIFSFKKKPPFFFSMGGNDEATLVVVNYIQHDSSKSLYKW